MVANRNRIIPVLLVAALAAFVAAIFIGLRKNNSDQPKVSENPKSGEFSVLMNNPWTKTNIQVAAGQTLIITATGKGIWKNISPDNPNAKPSPFEECGPDGTPPIDKPEYYSNISKYQCSTAYKGALIGKIGDNGIPFGVGASYKQVVNQSGIFYLGINDQRPEFGTNWGDNSGGYSVKVMVE